MQLSQEQKKIYDKIKSCHQGAKHYIHGVTGSGKSYLYFALAKTAIQAGQQVLLLVPEIGLTPQLQKKVQRYFFKKIVAVLHSGLSEKQRWTVWQACQSGEIRLVVGTRSALFAPFSNLGMIIVDEEHDLSYKQMSQVRYSARGVAFLRAQACQATVVLGSATPSLSSLYYIKKKQIIFHQLLKRYGTADLPQVTVVNVAGKSLEVGLCTEALSKITEVVSQGKGVLIFINRRGFAPSYWCPSCSNSVSCPGCGRPYTYHQHAQILSCHSCQINKSIPKECPSCGVGFCIPVGQGTEKIARFLEHRFHEISVVRMDRDTCSTWQKMQKVLELIHRDGAKIIVATQMLVKGHHIEALDLVVALGVDYAFYSKDFRAQELLLTQMLQVSGRSGRSHGAGRVIIQTAYTEHPLWPFVVSHRYTAGANYLLKQRAAYALPPFIFQLAIHATHKNGDIAQKSLQIILDALPQAACNHAVGPMPAALPMLNGLQRRVVILQSKCKQKIQDWMTVAKQLVIQRRVMNIIFDRDPVEM